MKKILVPVDFSETSYHAVEVASQIAKKTNSVIYLLHIVDIPDGYDVSVDVAEKIFVLKRTKQEFKKLLSQSFLDGVTVREIIQYNHVYDNIASLSEEIKADLIVIGSIGTKGQKGFFIGSNTQKVVRLSKIPVLTIKKRIEHFEPKNIVFASHFYTEVYPDFLSLKKIIDLYNIKIHLLKVISPLHFENTNQTNILLDKFIEKFNLKNYTRTIYNHKEITTGISNFCTEKNIDFLAIQTHGKTGIEKFFSKSITEKLINQIDLSILSIKINYHIENEKIIFPEIM